MDAIVELDLEFNLLMMNKAARRLFGCNKDQYIGRAFAQFVMPGDADRLYKIVRKINRRPENERSMVHQEVFGPGVSRYPAPVDECRKVLGRVPDWPGRIADREAAGSVDLTASA